MVVVVDSLAGALLEEEEADSVATGEVLGKQIVFNVSAIVGVITNNDLIFK